MTNGTCDRCGAENVALLDGHCGDCHKNDQQKAEGRPLNAWEAVRHLYNDPNGVRVGYNEWIGEALWSFGKQIVSAYENGECNSYTVAELDAMIESANNN